MIPPLQNSPFRRAKVHPPLCRPEPSSEVGRWLGGCSLWKRSFEDYLHEILTVEIASRRESPFASDSGMRFPEVKTLDQFDFSASDGVDAAQVSDLARGGCLSAPRT